MDEQPGDSSDLLGVPEVAGYLGVGRVTVYRWCRDGRLQCVKVGRRWRVRREALADFLREGERPATLAGRLGTFLDVPDNVVGVVQDEELLHRLDAAFFKVAEARGGALVKFYGWGPGGSAGEVRDELERHGLEAGRLEREGRLVFIDESATGEGREEALGRLLGEAGEGRAIWAAFDWTRQADQEEVLRRQRDLTSFVEGRRVVVKTAVLEEVLGGWSPETQRRTQTWHSGLIWVSREGLSLSRAVPLPES